MIDRELSKDELYKMTNEEVLDHYADTFPYRTIQDFHYAEKVRKEILDRMKWGPERG